MRRLALVIMLVAASANAADPIYDAAIQPPDVYSPLIWRHNGTDVHGFFYTDSQTQKIDLRIKYLEDKATKECVVATNAETKKVLGAAPTLWVVGAGALLVGIVGGVYAAHHF